MFTHILVATDGTELSQNCVKKAVQFAKETAAEVTFFYAKPAAPAPYLGMGAISDTHVTEIVREHFDELAREVLEKAAQEARTGEIKFNCISDVTDTPHEGIIDTAEAQGCDVIFMASHGRGSVTSFLLGSETQKVLSHSKIPVLVYR